MAMPSHRNGGNMKKVIITAIIAVVLITACIGQEEELPVEGESKEPGLWTIEDWRNHLSLMDPTLSQEASTLLPGFRNPQNLGIGTHLVYDLEMKGKILGAEMPILAIMDITFSGKETINGVDCFIIDLLTSMEMTAQNMSIEMEMVGTEWIDDTTGALVKAILQMQADLQEEEPPLPISITIERVGEEEYEGHDCWILELRQEMEISGSDAGEIEVLQYVDKESQAVVRQLMTFGDQKIDSGYIEPPPPDETEWELGNVETITTELGTYECQIIYIKQGGETLGTLLASKEFKIPLKYVFTASQTGSSITTTMILIAYTLG